MTASRVNTGALTADVAAWLKGFCDELVGETICMDWDYAATELLDSLESEYQIQKRPRGPHDGWGHSPRCVKGCGRAEYSRGMCRPCWEVARDAGEFVPFGQFVDEYRAAAQTGLDQAAIAADMGITCASLMRKLERYKLPVTRELRQAANRQRQHRKNHAHA